MNAEESCEFFCRLLKNNEEIAGKNRAELKKHANYQSPKIAIITCSDSRMPMNLYGGLGDIMGNVFVVPKANITRLEASPTETMKFVVSGGITNVQEQRARKKMENIQN